MYTKEDALGMASLLAMQLNLPAHHVLVTGSCAVEGKGNDMDIVARVSTDSPPTGYTETREYPTSDGWYSARDAGGTNLLGCFTEEAWEAWNRATNVCTDLAAHGLILDRAARVVVFNRLIDMEL